jgi:hypothetical protein
MNQRVARRDYYTYVASMIFVICNQQKRKGQPSTVFGCCRTVKYIIGDQHQQSDEYKNKK